MTTHSVIMISVLIFLLGCSNPSGPNSGSSAAITIISGQLVGWTYASGHNIALLYQDSLGVQRIASSSNIDSRGDFSLQNLARPPQSSWGFAVYPSANEYAKILENTFSCTDSSAILIASQLNIGVAASTTWIGIAQRANYNTSQMPKDGDFDVTYYYVTKDVKLSGTLRGRYSNGVDTIENEVIFHYNENFIKGWNKEVRLYSSQRVSKDSNTTVYTNECSFVNEEPSQGQWFYYSEESLTPNQSLKLTEIAVDDFTRANQTVIGWTKRTSRGLDSVAAALRGRSLAPVR